MTDEHSAQKNQSPDHDLNAKAVVAAGVALLVATAVSALVAWWLSVELRDRVKAQDPPRPVLFEARKAYEPPSPNLQTHPNMDLAELLSEEDLLLESYAWVTEGSVARVPIQRGMELFLETSADGHALVPERTLSPPATAEESDGSEAPE
jgi:hypothetical protein